MRRVCWCVGGVLPLLLLACLAALGGSLWADQTAAPSAKAAAKEEPVSFIRDVAPILKENCFACHDAKKKSGKYDMTTYEKLLAGGVNGEAVIPGKPEESELYTLMVSQDERRMPPRDKGEAVAADKAEVIRRWILQGAKLDAGIEAKADLNKELRIRWQPPRPPQAYPFPAIINALAFTPDGKRLVAGGYHELTVWEATTGKLVQRVWTRAERAYGMVFVPDGHLVVAGGRPGQEGDVRIYQLSAPGPTVDGVVQLDGVHDPKVLVKHLVDVEDAVLCVAATPDGKVVAAGGCDRTVRVFDLSKGLTQAELVQTVENHADWVLGCALTADGKYLLTASRDKTAKVWNLQARESVVTFPEHQACVYGVVAKPDGSLGYSVGADKQLRAWRVAGDGKQLTNAGGHTDEIFKVAINRAGTRLATAGADRTVRLWDAGGKLTTLRQWTGLTDHVFALTFSPDGELIAAGCYDGTVAVWKVADGALVARWNASPGW
ncbi:MAG: c-type cytochrome domain-containing protein, partial [Thermogemmata sp.]|nr:c-type cytochrome domain-containing protein [Thermogemmata sp.]